LKQKTKKKNGTKNEYKENNFTKKTRRKPRGISKRINETKEEKEQR